MHNKLRPCLITIFALMNTQFVPYMTKSYSKIVKFHPGHFYSLSMGSLKCQILSILIFKPCFRHTVDCTKVGDTSTQLKQTNKQPCKQTT